MGHILALAGAAQPIVAQTDGKIQMDRPKDCVRIQRQNRLLEQAGNYAAFIFQPFPLRQF